MIGFKQYSSYYDQRENLSDEILEEIGIAGRRALARAAKKRRHQLSRSRRKWKRRRASSSRIDTRAGRQARSNLYKKLSGGKGPKTIAQKLNVARRAKSYKGQTAIQKRILRAPKRRADRR
jgi:hypothetical protein